MRKQKAAEISLTDRAAELIKKASAAFSTCLPKLRVYIKGGGCAGLQYRFIWEGSAERDDLVFNIKGILLLIDCLSFVYLRGSLIDCQLKGKRVCLLVHNPNAATSCDCGASFQP
ncbi:HesB/YadR/YfhF family protein [Candidatus Tremblaya phenacola PAVE]|nr:HesB/YadR/YfhF family protein [Candidatus Tremblaya phenacola PAVE]